MDIQLHSEFFTTYMRAVERTESPRLFHLWTAVSAIGSALGRRTWLPFGMAGEIFPNHFILLVGPPAVRKSTAINVAARLLKDSTNVRFAPTDTGGQRQGFIRAMLQGSAKAEALGELIDAGFNMPFEDAKTKEVMESVAENARMIEPCDKHVLAAYWSELSGAIGQSNYSMIDFLVQAYDGQDYKYMTKGSEVTLKDTLMSILAATTPTSISVCLPALAEGHGFLSRIILVYGEENYQSVVWPELPSESDISLLKQTLSDISYNTKGPMEVTRDAKAYAETLYGAQLEISDQRFAYYKARRFTHLLKLSIVLAVSRKSQTIEKADIEVAHSILRLTERTMPDALGQFGLSPLSKVKQGILEFLRAARTPVETNIIVAHFHRDAKHQDIVDSLQDLLAAKAVVLKTHAQGGQLWSAVRLKTENLASDMAKFLIERKEDSDA